MTTAERNRLIDDARQAGIDVDLLDTNLALSVAERWRQHELALALVEELEKAGIARNARIQTDSSAVG